MKPGAEAAGVKRKRGADEEADGHASKRPTAPDGLSDPQARQRARREVTELYKCYAALAAAKTPSDGRTSFLKLLAAAEGAQMGRGPRMGPHGANCACGVLALHTCRKRTSQLLTI